MGLVRQLKIDEDMLQYVAINTEIIQQQLATTGRTDLFIEFVIHLPVTVAQIAGVGRSGA